MIFSNLSFNSAGGGGRPAAPPLVALLIEIKTRNNGVTGSKMKFMSKYLYPVNTLVGGEWDFEKSIAKCLKNPSLHG